MDWRPLRDHPDEHLWRGTVFRLLTTVYPYETPVDFMLVLDYDSPCELAVVVSTGHKAGAVLVMPPREAKLKDGAISISRDWLIENWTQWIVPECPVEDVRVAASYPPGVGGGP